MVKGGGDNKLPNLLLVVQLPPPVHGASVVNEQVASSNLLRKNFRLTVVRIDATVDLAEIRKFSLAKVARTFRTFALVALSLWHVRPKLAYLTMAPKGFAFYRDALLVFVFRLAQVPHVLHFHGRGMREAHLGKWSAGLVRFTLKKAVVIHLSRLLKDDISPFVNDEQMRFVANGVADPLPNGLMQYERILGADRVILFLGTMLESKGPMVLLDALARLKMRRFRFRALFAGPWRGSLTQERFNDRVHQLDLADCVTHLGGVYGDEKIKILQSADILAFPTHYENEAFPLVVLEGMAAGMVPVTSNIAALPEMIAEVGLCVPPQDPIALADALQSLLSNPSRLAQLQGKARERYLTHFTRQRFEQKLAEVLVGAAGAETMLASDRTTEMQT